MSIEQFHSMIYHSDARGRDQGLIQALQMLKGLEPSEVFADDDTEPMEPWQPWNEA